MKDLIIPDNNSKDCINIANIDNGFSGIIIAYKDGKPVQFIIAKEYEWESCNRIDCIDSDGYIEDSLLCLCNKLISNGVATNFKVIEFE